MITDLRMPPGFADEGIEAAAAIRSFAPQVGLMLLSQYVEVHHALRLMNEFSGGFGYLLKDCVSDLGAFATDVAYKSVVFPQRERHGHRPRPRWCDDARMTSQEAGTQPPAAVHAGVTPTDLAGIRRELFMAALAVGRHDHDPSREWEAFVEAAWGEAALAFGFIEREPWPEGLPVPGFAGDDRDTAQRDSDDRSEGPEVSRTCGR